MVLSILSGETSTPVPAPGPAMSADIPPWIPLAVLLLAMILAFIALLYYGALTSRKKKDADISVVRAWIAVTLIAGLLILTAVTLGGTDANLRNILVGGIVASASTAVAFYFATKANEASNAAVLKAAGIDGSASTAPPLSIDVVAVPRLSSPVVAGDTIAFQFTVKNNGVQKLTGVTLTDQLQAPAAMTYVWPTPASPGVLKSGESMTASTTYEIQAADLTAGSVRSRTIASGKPPSGPEVVSAPGVSTTSLSG